MHHPTAEKRNMKISVFALILLCGLFLIGLTGCSGGTKYQVDYCGGKDCYSNAKDAYRAGSAVTLYFELIATDTDYHFFLDGEPLPFDYDTKKGFVIRFTMPEHDVKLEVSSENSMLPQTGGGGGFAQVVNPLSEQTLEELEAETGYSLQLPEEQFLELSVIRIAAEAPVYSLEFLWDEDGNRYNFRLQNDLASNDISGMYYNWTESERSEEPSFEVHWTEEGQGVCLWRNENTSFSVSMSENATRDALVTMREHMVQACAGEPAGDKP